MGSKAGMTKRQGDVDLGTGNDFFIDNLGMRPQKFSQLCSRLLDSKELGAMTLQGHQKH